MYTSPKHRKLQRLESVRKNLDSLKERLQKEFEEGEHPRADDGRFTSGGGGSNSSSDAKSSEGGGLFDWMGSGARVGAKLGSVVGSVALGAQWGALMGPPGVAAGIVGGAAIGALGGALGGAKLAAALWIGSAIAMVPVHAVSLVARGIGHVLGAAAGGVKAVANAVSKADAKMTPKEINSHLKSMSETQVKQLLKYMQDNIPSDQLSNINNNAKKAVDFLQKKTKG